jgi:hypothetical protein
MEFLVSSFAQLNAVMRYPDILGRLPSSAESGATPAFVVQSVVHSMLY